MALRVLIIPDKFKGTLTAEAAAQAISRGWHRARRSDKLTLLPMSDGGDGFGDVMRKLLDGKTQKIKTVDAAHRPCLAPFWWEPKTKTAIIESARVIGLAMLPKGKFHPFELDTFGMGPLFLAARRKGARRCLVGIGGSATNDGGFGLARALGWLFLDENGIALDRWTELQRLQAIKPPPKSAFFQYSVEVAVDVQNQLLGRHGATRVYGPQKGLRAKDFHFAESCLARLAKIWKRDFGHDLSARKGAGAAGGLGFGLLAFLGVRMEPGFDMFAQHAGIDQRLGSAGLVITGEGSIDPSTLMGKGVGQIASRCLKYKIPCIGLAGVVKRNAEVARNFQIARGLTELASMEEALARPPVLLERLAAEVAKTIRE